MLNEKASPVKGRDLSAVHQTQAGQDLATTGKLAAGVHWLALMILFLQANAGLVPFSTIRVPSVVIALLALTRVIVSSQFGRMRPASWFVVYVASTVAVAASWSVFLVILMMQLGVDKSVTSITALMMSGISAGALANMTPSRSAHLSFQLTMWVPATLGAFFTHTTTGYFLAAIFGIFVVYLAVAGVLFNRKYLADLERQSELERARAAAVSASLAKSAFVANISHEIRTPLNGVLGMLELSMLGNTLGTETAGEIVTVSRSFLETAHGSAKLLLGLLNDVLDFSKIEAGRMELESVEFSLSELVSGVASLFASQANVKQIRLSATADPDLYVAGDPTRLRQVLINLVGNALKFTSEGEVAIIVSASDARPEEIGFAVRDTGIGIPADKQALIFDAFAQADGDTTRKYGGTGLGLAICQRLISLMDGVLLVESEVGKGSVFKFSLILERVGRPKEAGNAGEQVALPPLRVLVVEDNPVNQKVACGLLRRHGHTADIAGNGQEALLAVQRKVYDVVLMDIQMPVMGGFEATQEIRFLEDGNRLAIIGLTANASESHRRMCLEAGMDDYVAKPFTWQTLEAAMARQIGKTVRDSNTAQPVAQFV